MHSCLAEFRQLTLLQGNLNSSNKVSAQHFNVLGFCNAAAPLFVRVCDIVLAAGLISSLIASAANADISVNQVAPRSVLILDQSTSFRAWPAAIVTGMRAVLGSDAGSPIGIYVEHLDLYRFRGSEYQDNLRRHFSEKYRDRPIGVIASIGPLAFEYAMQLRGSLWPTVPLVFAAIPEQSAPNPKLLSGVTGATIQMSLATLIKASRILDPTLKRFAIVGDPIDIHPYYYPFSKELPLASRQLEFVDLTGLPIRTVRERVGKLPDHTTILYIGINADSEGMYVAAEVVSLIAEVANRPIIVDAETYFGTGATGGFLVSPEQIGRTAGRLVLRIIQGESPSSIPVSRGDPSKLVFDWRQLQRWNIDENRLPLGSEVRFRQASVWQQFRSQILWASALFLLQFFLIILLLYEHRRRHRAEIATRNTMFELAQMNRLATAGELSASIAHEVNQPLTGIVTKANAALRWLAAEKPELERARAALTHIVSAGHRASNIVTSVRFMLRKDTQENSAVDINKVIWSVLGLVWIDLRRNEIELDTKLNERLPSVSGNEIQLQQVILNLITNAIESMHSVERRELLVKSESDGSGGVHVSIQDTGIGIHQSNLDSIFKPMFTTKTTGMGMGLAICRSIIESHGGRIWASPGLGKGSIFHFSIPAEH
jgi:signal transduction histidine kinase